MNPNSGVFAYIFASSRPSESLLIITILSASSLEQMISKTHLFSYKHKHPHGQVRGETIRAGINLGSDDGSGFVQNICAVQVIAILFSKYVSSGSHDQKKSRRQTQQSAIKASLPYSGQTIVACINSLGSAARHLHFLE